MALCQPFRSQILHKATAQCSTRDGPTTASTRRRASLPARKEVLGSALSLPSGSGAAAPHCCRSRGAGPMRVEAARRVDSGRSLVLNSTLVAEEGREKDVERLCKGMLALADSRKKDKAAGILAFECHTDAYEPSVLHFWERYDTFLSMNDFHASPEYTKFLTEVRPLLVVPVQLSAYEYNDGKIGCMLNPIGPKGEGGLDDATGQGGSGGGASYKQSSQSVSQGITDGERDSWGLDNAVEMSAAKNAAVEAAAAIAKSFKNIFGGKTKN